MLLTHFSVFRHNKSVSVFLSFNCQKPPIPTFCLQRKRKKWNISFFPLIVIKGTFATRDTTIFATATAKKWRCCPPCLMFVHPSLTFMFSRACLWRMREWSIPPTMQVWVHKKGWMDEEGIFLFLFIFRTYFDWIVVQHRDCQICDIIRIMFPKHVHFNWHFRYRSSDNKYVLISFCRSPDQSCFFLFLL